MTSPFILPETPEFKQAKEQMKYHSHPQNKACLSKALVTIKALVEGNEKLKDRIRLLLPLAKGYVAVHKIPSTIQIIEFSEEVLSLTLESFNPEQKEGEVSG